MPDQEIQKGRWARVHLCREPGREVEFCDNPGKESKTGAWEYETYVPLSELEAEKELHRDIRVRAEDRLERLEEAESRATRMEDMAREKGDALVVMTLNAANVEKRAEAAEKALKEAAKDAWECIGDWGAYASDYFQEKHNLAGDVARFKALAGENDNEEASK